MHGWEVTGSEDGAGIGPGNDAWQAAQAAAAQLDAQRRRN